MITNTRLSKSTGDNIYSPPPFPLNKKNMGQGSCNSISICRGKLTSSCPVLPVLLLPPGKIIPSCQKTNWIRKIFWGASTESSNFGISARWIDVRVGMGCGRWKMVGMRGNGRGSLILCYHRYVLYIELSLSVRNPCGALG